MSDLSYQEQKSTVWKTTGILAAVTIIEVLCALFLPVPYFMIAILMIVMTLLKAFYIVGVFMHLKYEVKNLILTVLIPVTLLFWAIVAFLWEGDWWKTARETGLVDWLLD